MWATGLTSGTSSFWSTVGSQATERIVIEEVNPNGTGSRCEVYVRNIGKPAVIVDNIIISFSDGTITVRDKNLITVYQYDTLLKAFVLATGPVVQGELMKVDTGVTLTRQVVNPKTYTVKAFTPSGSEDAFQIVW